MAAGVAAGRGAGGAAGVLEEAVEGGGGAGAAGGSWASWGVDGTSGAGGSGGECGVDGAAGAVEPGTRSDAVHDAAGGISGVAGPLQRAAGCGGGSRHRQPDAAGDRRADRI